MSLSLGCAEKSSGVLCHLSLSSSTCTLLSVGVLEREEYSVHCFKGISDV